MERFSLELEATEVFYGKNQSCRACRETHRTGGNYANYDAIHIYSHPLVRPWAGNVHDRRPCGRVAHQRHSGYFQCVLLYVCRAVE